MAGHEAVGASDGPGESDADGDPAHWAKCIIESATGVLPGMQREGEREMSGIHNSNGQHNNNDKYNINGNADDGVMVALTQAPGQRGCQRKEPPGKQHLGPVETNPKMEYAKHPANSEMSTSISVASHLHLRTAL